MKRALRLFRLLPLAVLLVLGGCESLGIEDWLGEGEDPPLPGKRISVLAHEQTLNPAASADEPILLPPPEPNGAWPQAGGLAHHAMHHMVLPDQLREAWSRDIGEGSGKRERLLAQPVVADGRVFVIDAEAVVSAYDTDSGERLWDVSLPDEYEEDGAVLGGGLAYESGRLFITTGYAAVMALDAATGEGLWKQNVGAPMRAAPTVNGGRLFLLTVDNQTLALAANDGRLLWTHAGPPADTAFLGGAAPAVDAGVVISAYSTGELVALRVDTGAELWVDQVVALRRTDAAASLADIAAWPVIDRGKVFAVGHSGLMVAIDLRTGRRLWEVEVAGLQPPWVAGNYLFVLTIEAELVAVDGRDGRVLWIRPLQRWEDPEDRTGRLVWSGPLLGADRLIVAASHGWAYAVSPYTGALLGRQRMPAGVTIPPAVAGGTLYFLTDDADLVAYR